MPHTFIALSGGVDSAAAAALLLQAGHRLTGVHLRLLPSPDPRDAQDAADVARRLAFPFHLLDLSPAFRDTVIQNFIREYRQGRTPNPCVLCNRKIKFGALLDHALAMGAGFLATGHYARIERRDGRFLLLRGLDRTKDQSYFLCGLTQHQLSHILFPLGELDKPRVRRLAEAHGLANARRRDSQDICFVPRGKYAEFIEQTSGQPSPPGDFLDAGGHVLGRHKGLIRYTHGQHRGLGLSTEEPLYVLDKDPVANTVRLAPDSALWSRSLTAERMNWIALPGLERPREVTAKTRYSQHEAEALAEPLADGQLRLTFRQPQRAVTPGQAVVLYDGDAVLGGGTILRGEP